jgi:hypothetical protein
VGGEQTQRRPTTQDLKTNTNRKKQKTTRNHQNKEKAGNEPKVGKMAAVRELDPCRPDTAAERALEA